MTEPTRRFLVCYDYGMGGLWGAIDATSESEIVQKYPELVVMKEPPSWMSSNRFAEIMSNEVYNLSDEPSGILRAVVADRGK